MWILIGILVVILGGVAVLLTGDDLINKLILTVIIIAMALYVIYAFIWEKVIFLSIVKICAVVAIVLVAVKIIMKIFDF